MSYPVGTILHGKSTKGNLWIITLDNSFAASLLYDGTKFSVVTDIAYKRDQMSPLMRIADPADVASKLGSWANLPTWAQSLILTKPSPLPLPKPSTVIPPAVVAQIQRTLGNNTTPGQLNSLGLTKPTVEVAAPTSYRTCPARDGGCCDYKPYYGFTENYMYCVFCDDKKRNMQ
jgi:hypothetical protein